MFTQRGRRPRRFHSRHPMVFILGFMFLLLAPAIGTLVSAQGIQIQAQPSPTPTEAFDPPLQAEPTAEPPRPTEELPVAAEPTAAPTEELPVAIAEPGALTINKGVCDDSNFDPYTASGLDAFQEACFSPDGEFEFTVSDGGAYSETEMTSLGSVEFAVPVGAITIAETIPAGFGDPAVFCWSSLFPTPSDQPFIGNGPSWDVAEGEQVECWWFNVSEEEQTGHTVRVSKLACPDGVDPSLDYWQLAAECTEPVENIGFALTTGSGTDEEVTSATGEIEWTDVDLGASGDIQLDEEIPAGYGEPAVWCVDFPVIAADAQDFDFFSVTAADGLIAATPEQHEPYIFSCAYFNFADAGAPGDLVDPNSLEDGSGNIVTVIKHRCPMGVVEDAELEDYQEICTQEHDDIEFTLSHAGGGFPATTAGGQAQWLDVPMGDFAIQETVPAGFLDPLVWCGFNPSISLPELTPSTGGLVTGSFEDDESEYVCSWFNIPDPDANNSIAISKYLCPAGIPYVNDNDFYKANCPDAHEGVEFTLTAPHGEFPDTTDENGMVEWTGIPLGEFSIQETIPEGYGEPVVLCNFVDVIQGIGFQNGPLSRIQAPGGLISAPIEEPNVEYRCSWFNIPLPETRVVINKRICDDDVDFVLTGDNVINDVITACPALGEGIEFTLDSASGSSTQAIVDGATWWDGVPNGPITVTEEIPAGYGEPVWYCAFNYYEDGEIVHVQPVSADAPGGVHAASLDDPAGGVYYCWVFNIPGEPGGNSVVIHKWLCPEGFDPFVADNEYMDTCTETLDGIEFRLTSDLGIAVLDTAAGQVEFGGLPVGTIGVQETVPPGYGIPYVICYFNGNWHDMLVSTGYFEYEFSGDHELLTCHWFNLHGEPGDVTILKWTCPTGYDLFAAGADPYADCTEATNGIEFQFGLAADESLAALQTTGDIIDGGVFFDNLEPGAYKAVELVPEGIGAVFVLECTGHIMGVLQPYPLQMGNVLEIEIDAGEHLTCHWFNVPESGGGAIVVTKYTCTTETFVSEVDCEIEEDGKTFDLLRWNVGDGVWEAIDTQVTDGVGTISWIGLEAGDYGLDEHGSEWCHLTTIPVFGEGDYFYVYENEETLVNVYNCDSEPGKPGDTPEKYPNTGAPPPGRDDTRLQP